MRKLLVIILGIVLLGSLLGSYFIFGSYSEGYRAGKIMKLSKKGVFFKTYEGQLDIGGLENSVSDGAATTIWKFSVRDEQIVKDIHEAVDNGWRVKLHYEEKFYKLFFFGDTKYFVDKVEQVKPYK